jgi:hypothetical protein
MLYDRAMSRPALAIAAALAVACAPSTARAFCGFYVSGADQGLFNNATMVVMMRDGTRTVLSMQNNYQGPPEGFALVIPVPVVLAKGDVRTLPRALFQRVDTMAAPRLVEYWEQDPCPMFDDADDKEGGTGTRAKGEEGSMGSPKPKPLGVKIEAQFDVDEYEILILSAKDSGGLDEWLREHGYKIPAGAADVLRPYVASGSKFFVAKVDPEKVRFDGEQAMLSPLRFHYDTDTFTLPIRLGLLNAGPAQDLIVHIFSRDKRYEAANYTNVFIPTNLDVADGVRNRYGEFYAALFDRAIASNPRTVVTEYAWDATSCDPCPGPTLTSADLALLGGEVVKQSSGFVLTRLHARYSKESLGDDLVFREAPAIVGGREDYAPGATQSTVAKPSTQNFFQGRYVIRHPWTGPVTCDRPQFGVWGGPTRARGGSGPAVKPAQDLAFAPRGGLDLASLLRVDVPALGITAGAPTLGTARKARVPRLALGFLGGAAIAMLLALGAIGVLKGRRVD